MTAERDPGLVVREARPDEWAVAGAVVEAAYRADPLYAGGDDDYLRHLADVADRARTCRILVAVEGGVISGCLTLVPGPESPYAETEGPGEAGIRMLGVDPGWQGRGVARALMDAAADTARGWGRRRLTLVVRAGNGRAQRLYEGLGYRRAPARDFEPIPGILLEGYELDL